MLTWCMSARKKGLQTFCIFIARHKIEGKYILRLHKANRSTARQFVDSKPLHNQELREPTLLSSTRALLTVAAQHLQGWLANNELPSKTFGTLSKAEYESKAKDLGKFVGFKMDKMANPKRMKLICTANQEQNWEAEEYWAFENHLELGGLTG